MPEHFWRRSLSAVTVVTAVLVLTAELWHVTGWPGKEYVFGVVLGFGTVLGSRYGADGRVGGAGLGRSLLLGTVAAALLALLGRIGFRS